jgi:hypothetical protein
MYMSRYEIHVMFPYKKIVDLCYLDLEMFLVLPAHSWKCHLRTVSNEISQMSLINTMLVASNIADLVTTNRQYVQL